MLLELVNGRIPVLAQLSGGDRRGGEGRGEEGRGGEGREGERGEGGEGSSSRTLIDTQSCTLTYPSA